MSRQRRLDIRIHPYTPVPLNRQHPDIHDYEMNEGQALAAIEWKTRWMFLIYFAYIHLLGSKILHYGIRSAYNKYKTLSTCRQKANYPENHLMSLKRKLTKF